MTADGGDPAADTEVPAADADDDEVGAADDGTDATDGAGGAGGSGVPDGSGTADSAGSPPASDPSPDSDHDPGPDPRSGPVAAIRWAWTTDQESVAFAREVLTSALAVLLVGVLLFAVSGVWPPMVAVESGSMEPNMYRGDLVFIMEEHRFASDAAYADTGVVTYRDGRDAGYRTFGDYGDVIIFAPPDRNRPPIIHRTRFWVDEGENWYAQADEQYLPADANSCSTLTNCPAPYAGFVTKGDANAHYDQAGGISPPVKPGWIRGTGEIRVPWVGHVRLFLSELLATAGSPVGPSTDADWIAAGESGTGNAAVSPATPPASRVCGAAAG